MRDKDIEEMTSLSERTKEKDTGVMRYQWKVIKENKSLGERMKEQDS